MSQAATYRADNRMDTPPVSVILLANPHAPRRGRHGARGARGGEAVEGLRRQRYSLGGIQVLTPLPSESLPVSTTGELLVFLDGDLDPMPTFVAAHVGAHSPGAGQVVIGYSVPRRPGPTDFVSLERRAWWEDHFYAMRQRGHRFAYDDLAGSNFSVPTVLFRRLGGFDPTLADPLAQVLDFGVRALAAGVPFVHAARAAAYRRAAWQLPDVLAQDRRRGRVDVVLAQRHGALRGRPLIAGASGCGGESTISTEWPLATDTLALGLRPLLACLERLRLRGAWQRLYAALRCHAYWRGWRRGGDPPGIAHRQVPALSGTTGGAFAPRTIEISLHHGLAAAERRLDEERQAGVRLRLGQQLIGEIPARPGAEPLRGVHLRSALATELAGPLAQALQRHSLDGPAGQLQLHSPLLSLLQDLAP